MNTLRPRFWLARKTMSTLLGRILSYGPFTWQIKNLNEAFKMKLAPYISYIPGLRMIELGRHDLRIKSRCVIYKNSIWIEGEERGGTYCQWRKFIVKIKAERKRGKKPKRNHLVATPVNECQKVSFVHNGSWMWWAGLFRGLAHFQETLIFHKMKIYMHPIRWTQQSQRDCEMLITMGENNIYERHARRKTDLHKIWWPWQKIRVVRACVILSRGL